MNCGPKIPVLEEKPVVQESAYGLLNLETLAANRAGVLAGKAPFMTAMELLLQEAEKAMTLNPPSVMDKQAIPPSGNKHDYMSLSPYWWPNPDTPDNLPYIRKDGQVNPERNAYDKVPGALMSEAVSTLSLAYYFTGGEPYAEKAARLLRTWFLDADTYMAPHLEYGQFVPGRSSGRSVGIIETRNFVYLIDYEKLLQSSEAWSDEDHRGFKQWMDNYLSWLLTSDLGREEINRANNHGSWCEFQVMALSQFTGNTKTTIPLIENFGERRVFKQIMPDGTQPEELERTKSFNYSVFNLDALVKILMLTDHQPEFQPGLAEEISRISQAIEFLIPYVNGDEIWPHEQITGIEHAVENLIPMLVYMIRAEEKSAFIVQLDSLLKKYPGSRYILITDAISVGSQSAPL